MAESELHGAPARPARLARGVVSAAYAELSRRVAGGLHCRHAAMTLRLEWPAAAAAPVTPDLAGIHGAVPNAAALCLDGPAGPLWLDDGAALLHGLSGIDPDAIASAPAAQQQWLNGALLGRLARTPLASARELRRAPPPEPSEPLVPLFLRLDDGTHMVATLARAAPQTWLALLGQGDWQGESMPLAALGQLPIVLPVLAATHRLPAAALRKLAPGDVILPDAPRFDLHGSGSLSLGGRLIPVRYGAPGLLTILSMEMQLNPNSQENEDSAAGADGDEQPRQSMAADVPPEPAAADLQAPAAAIPESTLEQLPLALSFELGTLKLSLGQLRALAPGAVLQLENGSADSIAVLCSGRELGRGEAVDVDGRLGIRLISWSAAC